MKSCKKIIWIIGILGLSIIDSFCLPNPASQYCFEQGGKVQIAKRGDGGAYGLCLFSNAYQCEEWALFHGECPVGGIDITHHLTPEGIYCASKGGSVMENEVVCLLPSGKTCPSQSLYQGECPT